MPPPEYDIFKDFNEEEESFQSVSLSSDMTTELEDGPSPAPSHKISKKRTYHQF